MEDNRPDTVPGFTMQSEHFFLKFITGLQCGVSSKLLEYETDWYEVMEIILSRLEDEPEAKENFELIASRDLEYWARNQPGGDSLNLRISVMLEEKKYFAPPLGIRKALKLVFNDRFYTHVIFHVKKKAIMRSLLQISELAVAEMVDKEETLASLESELPLNLIPGVTRAFHNCWTPRFFRTKVPPCPASCGCSMTGSRTYVAQLVTNAMPDPMLGLPEPQPVLAPPLEAPLVAEAPQPSTSSQSRRPAGRQAPKKNASRRSKRMKAKDRKRKSKSENSSKECQSCSGKAKVSTRSNCDKRQKAEKPEEVRRSPRFQSKYLNGLKVRIKSLQIEVESLVMKVKGKKHKAEEVKSKDRQTENTDDNKLRKSSRLSSLKKSLKSIGKGRKRGEKSESNSEEIFEPRPGTSGASSSSSKKSKSTRKLSTRASNREMTLKKRSLKMQDGSPENKKRRHS